MRTTSDQCVYNPVVGEGVLSDSWKGVVLPLVGQVLPVHDGPPAWRLPVLRRYLMETHLNTSPEASHSTIRDMR